MYKNEADTPEISAFRAAEKKYQRVIEQVIKFKRGKPRGTRRIEHPPNLDGVIDVHAPETDILQKTFIHTPLTSLLDPHLQSTLPPSAQAFTFPAHPGFVLFTGTISSALRRRLLEDCWTRFPNHPAHTNFNKAHGSALDGLWHAAHAGLNLSPETENHGIESSWRQWASGGSGIPATHLLRKLRWASIGPVFDWTRREYLINDPYLPLPEYLAEHATNLAAVAEEIISNAKANDTSSSFRDEFRDGREHREHDKNGVHSVLERPLLYRPDAALINYYHPGDTLCGHIDDAEADLSQPLVSISLGCPAIFLLGGESRDIQPTALLLRGGDVVVLGGKARKCYHGVPRLLSCEEMALPQVQGEVEGEGKGEGKDGGVEEVIEKCGEEEEDADRFEEYMRSCRINISVRATLHEPSTS